MEKTSSPKSSRELSVGQVAARSGLAVSAIHFYEQRGLIASRRTAGNQRRYPRAVLRRLAVIKVAQRTGIPLAEIGEAFADLPADRILTSADWKALSMRWKSELDERIAKLTALRDHMTGCIACGCLSLRDCPLRNPDDIAAREGPGAREFD
jgi:MerR family redox-sensitive transcriptional activator SoxR